MDEEIVNSSLDKPLHVVAISGQIVIFAAGFEIVLSPAAAEETSRRISSVAAVARMDEESVRQPYAHYA